MRLTNRKFTYFFFFLQAEVYAIMLFLLERFNIEFNFFIKKEVNLGFVNIKCLVSG